MIPTLTWRLAPLLGAGQFAQTSDPSCLNRWITPVSWDVEQLNEHRLAWLQGHSSTRYSARGVIAIDNTPGRP